MCYWLNKGIKSYNPCYILILLKPIFFVSLWNILQSGDVTIRFHIFIKSE